MDIKIIVKALFVLFGIISYFGSFIGCAFLTVIFCSWFDDLKEQKRNKKDV